MACNGNIMNNYLSNIGISHKVGLTPKKYNNSTTINATPIAFTVSNGAYPQMFMAPQIIYCKAVGCTSCKAPGQKHCCRVCGSTDSDHRSKNCPLGNQLHYINNTLPGYCTSRPVYCRAVGCTTCTYPGQKHYCSSCGDDNSNHLTTNCKRVHHHIYCRAVGCTSCNRPGQKHYCRKCKNMDSDHITSKCTKKTAVIINGILYHL